MRGELVTYEQAANVANMTVDGIRYHVKQGNLVAIKREGSRTPYLKRSDVEALKKEPAEAPV